MIVEERDYRLHPGKLGAYLKLYSEEGIAVQKEKIDQALNQGVKAMAISVIDPENQSRYLKSVAGRTILLTQDNDAPDSGRLCYIGTDNYAAGRAAGALVRQAMPEGGTVVIFVGQVEPLNAQERDRKSTRLNSSHRSLSRMPSSA